MQSGNRTRGNQAGDGSVPIAGLEPMHTPKEVAVWLQVDESSIRRWFGEYPGVLRLGAGKYATIRIPKSVIEAFMRERSR